MQLLHKTWDIAQACQDLLGVSYGGLPLNNLKAGTVEEALAKLAFEEEFSHSFQQLDCVTYVETVMAMLLSSLSHSKHQSLIQHLKQIRYQQKPYSFLNRCHFLSVDWLPHNQRYLQDLTTSFNLPIGQTSARIDKPNWLCHHPVWQAFNNQPLASDTVKAWLAQYWPSWTAIEATVHYLPLETVIAHYDDIKKQLPSATLMTIVRPNWDLRNTIGSFLLMSHLGIIIKSNETMLQFYHATSDSPKMVVEVQLLDYLRFCQTIKSIGGVQFYQLCLGEKNGG